MDKSQWITAAIAATPGLIAIILAYTKRKPGQKEREEATIAAGLLNTAKGTVDLVTDELQEQYLQAVAQRKEVEAENRKLVEALRSAQRQVAQIESELSNAHIEITSLRAQVQQLSAQVAALGNGNN